MRENRPYGSEGGVATSHPYPYHGPLRPRLPLPSRERTVKHAIAAALGYHVLTHGFFYITKKSSGVTAACFRIARSVPSGMSPG
jgi:hypothetical protein